MQDNRQIRVLAVVAVVIGFYFGSGIDLYGCFDSHV